MAEIEKCESGYCDIARQEEMNNERDSATEEVRVNIIRIKDANNLFIIPMDGEFIFQVIGLGAIGTIVINDQSGDLWQGDVLVTDAIYELGLEVDKGDKITVTPTPFKAYIKPRVTQ
jgi:hypothetical protein